MYMLDNVLPQVAKLSSTLQTEHLDLLVISSLVDAALHTLDDTVLPSANWVLELLDKREHLEEAAGIKVTLADIITFQEQAAKPFIAHLKENISSRFTSSSDVVSALSIFNPRKAPKVDSPDLPQYGEQAITTLLAHYGAEKPAELVCNDMMRTLFPNLCKIATISLSIPVSTTSVERSFSQMKLIKIRLRSSLNDKTFLT